MAKQYTDAGKILDRMLRGGASLKSLLYSTSQNPSQIPTLHALVCETLKCAHPLAHELTTSDKPILDQVLHTSGILTSEPWLASRGHIVHVMLYDLLIGKGISGAGM
jgi:hypothetical protein